MGNRVFIGIPCWSGNIPVPMVNSLLELAKPSWSMISIIERQMIDTARNLLLRHFLESWCDYMLFVDDDNPIPSNTLEILMADDKDIVIAPILTRIPKAWKHDLCAFYGKTVKWNWEEIKVYNHITTFKEDGPLHKIDAGGTGCMLIKRHVAEGMFKKYKLPFEKTYVKLENTIEHNGIVYDSRTMSEDVEFCERAINEWYELWLDERVRPLHMTAPWFVQYTP